jgi:hypothetical protein
LTYALVEPDSDYTVVFEGPAEEDELLGAEDREPLLLRTGSARDTAPPTLLDEPTVEVSYHPASPLGPIDSCGGGLVASWSMLVSPPRADDDMGVAGFRLLRQEGEGFVEASATVVGDNLLYDSRAEGGEHVYVVEAFDHAGNVVRSSEL